jgi:predicted nucleic acid-binding protein
MEPDTTGFIAATAWENDLILITEDEKLKESTQIKVFNEKRHTPD